MPVCFWLKDKGPETLISVELHVLIKVAPDSRLIKAIMLAKTYSGYEMLLLTPLLVERNEHGLYNLLRNL